MEPLTQQHDRSKGREGGGRSSNRRGPDDDFWADRQIERGQVLRPCTKLTRQKGKARGGRNDILGPVAGKTRRIPQ